MELAAKQDVYTAKCLDGFGDGSAAWTHGTAIAAYASDPVLPALTVLAIALALANEITKLGTPSLVLYLLGWQTRHHIVSMGQQKANKTYGQWG